MPRVRKPRACGCGCGGMTRGGYFLRGHDARTLSAIVEELHGIHNLKLLVERFLGRRIVVRTE